MNWAHVHLAVNHVPVILVPATVGLLVFAVVRGSGELTRVSLGLLVFTALCAGGVYLTGEPAEGVVKDLLGVSKEAIEEHEEAAEIAAIVTGLAGILALGALIAARGGRAVPPMLLAATFVIALAGAGLLARTANLGAYIHHPELAIPGPPL